MAASAVRADSPPDNVVVELAEALGAVPPGGAPPHQADRRQDRRGPRLEIAATEGHEPVERIGVGVVGHGLVGQGLGAPVELGRGVGHPGAPGQVGEHRLVGRGVGLLGQVADRQEPRRPLDGARIGSLGARQDAEQRRLADPVGAHHADAVASVDSQRHPDEDVLAAERTRDPTGAQHEGRRYAPGGPSPTGKTAA